MMLLDSWMPSYDVRARYAMRVAAPPAQVWTALLETDFSRPWLVRVLMAVRMLPALLRSPRSTWRRLARPGGSPRTSLAEGLSGFMPLEQMPPTEIVLGITGRFWTRTADVVAVAADRFRDPLAAGLAQAAWNFAVTETSGGSELSTETRVRCADAGTRRQFVRYWRVIAPGSALIRYAIMRQVRREALAAVRA